MFVLGVSGQQKKKENTQKGDAYTEGTPGWCETDKRPFDSTMSIRSKRMVDVIIKEILPPVGQSLVGRRSAQRE